MLKKSFKVKLQQIKGNNLLAYKMFQNFRAEEAR